MSTTTDTEPTALLELARSVVARAEPGEELEVAVSSGSSTSVKVHGGEVESMTTAGSRSVGIRVIRDGRVGFASAGTFDPTVLDQMLVEARDNASFAEPDEFAGLTPPDGVEAVEIDLWHDEMLETTADTKIGLALELERRVLAADDRIAGVRVASYGDGFGVAALASTSGIESASRSTSASVSVQALADDDDRSRTGWSWDGARHAGLLDLGPVVDRAVTQATGLIGAEKPDSGTVSLVLDPNLTATVLGLISGTLTGDRVLKGRSPFADRLGEQVGALGLTIACDPTDPTSLGADSHDGEGLATRRNPLVVDGVLDRFLHDGYTGRRSGAGSTGSAVRGTRSLPGPGVQALSVAPGSAGTLEDLIASVDDGILVYALAGLHSGVNAVSGDFSVGVEGIRIRNGALAEPISECTIGSTLQRLLLDIAAIGSEVTHLPSGTSTPPVRIDGVRLSGN